MGQHDLSIARAYVQRPGIADRFRALYVEPMLVQVSDLLTGKVHQQGALIISHTILPLTGPAAMTVDMPAAACIHPMSCNAESHV